LDEYVQKTIVDYEGVRKYKHIVSFNYVENGDLAEKNVLCIQCFSLIFSAAVFVSNILCPDIYFASFSRDGSRNSYKSAGKVWVKSSRIKIDEKLVVKSEEIPIRYCRVVLMFREMRRQTNGQRDLTRLFLLGHYATNRQVAGSIPDGVIGIFQ
jgi:hypothetical protein